MDEAFCLCGATGENFSTAQTSKSCTPLAKVQIVQELQY